MGLQQVRPNLLTFDEGTKALTQSSFSLSAGGAMGAMVRRTRPSSCTPGLIRGHSTRSVHHSRQHHRVPDHLRHPSRHGRPLWTAHGRRLLPHLAGRAVGVRSGQHGQGGALHASRGPCVERCKLTISSSQVYPVGSVHHLRRGDAKQYSEHCESFVFRPLS